MAECIRCNGAGKLTVRIAPTGERRTTLSGVVIEDGGGWSTRPCPCVRDLPPVDGKASWWDTEVAWERIVQIGPWDEPVELTISAEVPRREDGRRVHLRGNRYYPTMVNIGFPAEAKFLGPDDLRRLAAALEEAAAAAEAIDEPCADLCGHWWPCSCVGDAVGKALAPLLGVEALTNWERFQRDWSAPVPSGVNQREKGEQS